MPRPQVILFGLLPPLLFESAFNVDYHVFIKVASMAIVMALPGVILCTVRPLANDLSRNGRLLTAFPGTGADGRGGEAVLRRLLRGAVVGGDPPRLNPLGHGPRAPHPPGQSPDSGLFDVARSVARHQWSSGRIHRCHQCDPGSIPG